MRDSWFRRFEEGLIGVYVTTASEAAFKDHYRQIDISSHIIDIVWETIVSVSRPTGMVDPFKIIAAVPTVEEWLDAARNNKKEIATQ